MTSEPPESPLSHERTFDGLVDMKPLLFRLHSPKYSATIFDEKKRVLRASRHASEHRDISEGPSALEALAEFPSSLTLDEESDAVDRHITSWVKKSKQPSNFISLTFNVLFVLWDWNRRRFRQTYRSEDDFIIIVLKSSALRGRAKLGIEMIKDQDVYKLTDFAEEVIVASSIQSSAILGTMPMSQLEEFIPSWCQELLGSLEEDQVSEEKAQLGFKSFLKKLEQPAVQGDDCTRQSLRFALELLDPMLVSATGKLRRADTGNVFHSVAKGHPRDESEDSAEYSSRATASEQTVAGKGYVSHTKAWLGNEYADLHQAEFSQRTEVEASLRLAGGTDLRLSPTVSALTRLHF
jgi:hypothetical protein